MNTLVMTATSPFDSIKQVRPDGTEYWSARDLQALMGYDKWERFESVIERAMLSAENQGLIVDKNFPIAGKVSGTRGPAQKDYELSRIAGYLVSLNGDPRKKEVAAAQAYFVVNTIENETRKTEQAKPLTKAEQAKQEIETLGSLVKLFPELHDWSQHQAKASAQLMLGMTAEREPEERLISIHVYLTEQGWKQVTVDGKKRFTDGARLIHDGTLGKEVARLLPRKTRDRPAETGRRGERQAHEHVHPSRSTTLRDSRQQHYQVTVSEAQMRAIHLQGERAQMRAR